MLLATSVCYKLCVCTAHTHTYIHTPCCAAGHECVLAGGRREVRSTEVRIACSPDRRLHILVREPDFCSYIFVLYSPAMCELGMFQPIPVA
eukprot:1140847-Pelagomonas_calceolata.AAC.2